jgi:hypothetical protein
MSTRASVTLSVKEDWATLAMQLEPTQQLNLLIDPQILATEESFSLTRVLGNGQSQPSLYLLDGIEGAGRRHLA